MVFYFLGGAAALGGFAAMFSDVAPWCHVGPLAGAFAGGMIASLAPWFEKPRQ